MEDLQNYTILFLLWIVSTIVIRAIFKKSRTKVQLPPSPSSLPIIGHLHHIGPLPHQSLYKLSNRYGPLMQISLGSVPCVVASSPEMAKEFFKTHEASFSSRPPPSILKHVAYPDLDLTFAPYGPYWKFLKKVCMSRLLGSQTLNLLLPVRTEERKRFLTTILKKAESNESVDVGKELKMLTNNIISRMIMSKRCVHTDDEADEITELVNGSAELVGTFNVSDFIWFCKNLDLQGLMKKAKGIHDRFDQMVENIIKEHRAERKGDDAHVPRDFLDILLQISDDEGSDVKMTKENIKSFFLDVFVAGTNTSSITLEWALAELLNHPKIMKKAVEEVDSVVGKTRLVEESDVVNLPYIQAIVKETLRLHPPGPILSREASQSCNVNGYDIPEKTRLLINVWAISRDPNHWESPLEFKPERFYSGEGSENVKQVDVRGQHFQLLPFGSGRRVCPGTTLGLQVVHTSLASMLQCFEWKANGIVNMDEGPGLTLPRAHSLVCVPKARHSPMPQ
ncbi:Cytochrome P450, E-class, group I [Parasponia andersonii]|uniref:Cytochrome P450, E-class, group I n=1 Tax=Parasponia andersonii TaxID=3476 RepID=A0A2P5CAQ4_PARAD|nr:Cytochrome P450, E-class, group I [Parasponia andersonii]